MKKLPEQFKKDKLMKMNDNYSKSFVEIATWIEENL